MAFYFIIFAVVCLLSLFALLGSKPKTISAISIAIMLILVAGLRKPGIDRDSLNYDYFFNWVSTPLAYFTKFSQYYFYEAGYYLLPAILKTVFHADVVWFFIFFAVLCVLIKFKAIWKLSEFPMLSVLIYFCHYFILEDMTQIREGIASAILLLCVVEIKNKNFFRFILLLSVSIFFHYSSLIFIPFFFLNPHRLNKKAFYAILIVPHLFYFLKINVITILIAMHLGVISDKLAVYNELLDAGIFTELTVYNSVIVVEMIFCAFLIWKSDFFYTKNKYAFLLIKIYTIGLACWMLFTNIPVIAFRSYGYLDIVQIILVPFILYYIEERYMAVAFTFFFGAALFYVDVIHNELLQPYESIIKL